MGQGQSTAPGQNKPADQTAAQIKPASGPTPVVFAPNVQPGQPVKVVDATAPNGQPIKLVLPAQSIQVRYRSSDDKNTSVWKVNIPETNIDYQMSREYFDSRTPDVPAFLQNRI